MAKKGTYSINCGANWRLQSVIDCLNAAKVCKMNEPSYLDITMIMRKPDNPVSTGNMIDEPWFREWGFDRKFPLETVELQSYNQNHEKDVKTAIIHTGAWADDFTYSMNALAITTAFGIFFRSNKFNTSTEEGRKLLAHELTHIAQFEKPELKNEEELESEAEQEENIEVFDPDPIETVTVGKHTYRLRKSQQKKYIRMVADNIIQWVTEQKTILDEQEFLKLLIAIKNYVTGFRPLWQTKTAADRWLEEEFRHELRWRTGL